MSGDQEQEYFADGIVDDIITGLSRIHWFFVIARTSSFVFKNRNVSSSEVSRELGVRYVFEGSVRRAANRVRITGQLVDTEAGRHIWASKFDGDLDDVFSLQDQVTASVVHAIEPSIRTAEIERARSKRTSNLTAYDLYLRSIPEAERLEAAGLRRAKALLEAALVIDIRFAEAWSALADCYGRLVIGGWEEEERGFAEALNAATRAVEADPENGSVLSVASWLHAISGKPVDIALAYARRALDLHPHSSFVIAHCARALIYAGECEGALDHLQRAKRMNPLDPQGHRTANAIALAHFYMRQFAEAESIERAVLHQHPKHPVALGIMAASLAQQGRAEEANRVVRDLLAVFPTASVSKLSRPQTRHDWMSRMWSDALRSAGLPE
jgi:adenylate cyclase